MELKDERRIAARRDAVFAALNDPEVLRQCIPGCETLEKLSDSEMRATVALKVGPVKARFQGKVQLSNIDPPRGYTITGAGSAGPAGAARGGADVTLTEDGDGTVLSYDVNVDVVGKLAQLGARLIDSTARTLAGQFFTDFARIVGGTQAAVPTQPPAAPEPPPSAAAAMAAAVAPDATAAARRGVSPVLWVALGAVAVVVVLLVALPYLGR